MIELLSWELVFGFLGTLTIVAGFVIGVIKNMPKIESAIKTEMIELKSLINSLELRLIELKDHQEKIDDRLLNEIEKLELRIEKIMDLIITELTK